jgi:hypothetical protein
MTNDDEIVQYPNKDYKSSLYHEVEQDFMTNNDEDEIVPYPNKETIMMNRFYFTL